MTGAETRCFLTFSSPKTADGRFGQARVHVVSLQHDAEFRAAPFGQSGKTMRKALTVFSKRSYLNKYYYVRTCKKKPLCDKQVLFESFHGTNLNDSPFAMMRELAKDPAFTIYYTSKKS